MEFNPEKSARVEGNLAADGAVDGRRMSGVIVRKDFSYQMMHADDLALFSQLAALSVLQRITVPFHQSHSALRHFLGRMFELSPARTREVPESVFNLTASGQAALAELRTGIDSTSDATAASSANSKGAVVAAGASTVKDEKVVRKHHVPCVTIGDTVHVLQFARDHVVVEWPSAPVQDMLADAVVALILSIEANPHNLKVLHAKCNHHHHQHHAESASTAASGDFPVMETEPLPSHHEPVDEFDVDALYHAGTAKWEAAQELVLSLYGKECVHIDDQRGLMFVSLCPGVPPPTYATTTSQLVAAPTVLVASSVSAAATIGGGSSSTKGAAGAAGAAGSGSVLEATILIDRQLDVYCDQVELRDRLQTQIDRYIMALFPIPFATVETSAEALFGVYLRSFVERVLLDFLDLRACVFSISDDLGKGLPPAAALAGTGENVAGSDATPAKSED